VIFDESYLNINLALIKAPKIDEELIKNSRFIEVLKIEKIEVE
jgi:hypothetical protein